MAYQTYVRHDAGKFARFANEMVGYDQGATFGVPLLLASIAGIIVQFGLLVSLTDSSFSWYTLAPVAIIVSLWTIGFILYFIDQGNDIGLAVSKYVTKYNALLDTNKILAEPLLLKMYELYPLVSEYKAASEALDERVYLFDQIFKKDLTDKQKSITVDNSDVDAVRELLKAYKEIS